MLIIIALLIGGILLLLLKLAGFTIWYVLETLGLTTIVIAGFALMAVMIFSPETVRDFRADLIESSRAK